MRIRELEYARGVTDDARMTPHEHALSILELTPVRLEAELHANAIEADAEMLGVPAREYAEHVLAWIESIFETGDDTEAESEVLLRIQEGAALVLVG